MEPRRAALSTSKRGDPKQLCDVLSVSSHQQGHKKRTPLLLISDQNSHGDLFVLFVLMSANLSGVCRRCIKSQLIDLAKEGYSPSFMDNFQPDIKVSDW